MSDAPLAITNTIRKLRFAHGEMTQQALAERIGVTRQTVNAIELGKYSPSLEVAFRIAAPSEPEIIISFSKKRVAPGRPCFKNSPRATSETLGVM